MAFEGDPGHEGGSQPMRHLKGGMAAPNTQQPMTSEAMTGGRVSGDAAAPVAMGWDWYLKSGGTNSGNDSRNKPV